MCQGQVHVYAWVDNDPRYSRGEADVQAGDTDVVITLEPPNAPQSSGMQKKDKPDWSQFEEARAACTILQQSTNKEQLEAEIDRAKAAVERFGAGHVIVGKVVLDGPGDVRGVVFQSEI